MLLFKICGDEAKWYLLLIIGGIILCSIERQHVLLYLIVDECYYVYHLSIRVIVIQLHQFCEVSHNGFHKNHHPLEISLLLLIHF